MSGSRSRAEFAWLPVGLIAVAVVATLLLVANAYGFHRDELYFVVAGRHPDWGYVDQPPLTPLLSAGAVALGGLSPLSLRVLPALAAAAIVVLAAATAREFVGRPRAQLLAAGIVALSAILGLGHLDSTATYDVLAWTVVTWLVARLLARAEPRTWVWVGLAAGLGLQNKHLVLLLGFGLVVGMLLARRWDAFRTPWAWAGVGVALLIWAPNIAWQAANDWPQLRMASVIAERSSEEEALLALPMQLILAGPFLWPVLVVGLWWLLRSREGAPWRAIGWAYLVILVLTIAMRGQVYYPAGLLPAVLAAGAIPVDLWLDRGHRLLRRSGFAGAAVLSGASIAVLMLPLLPPAVLAATPLPELYGESAEQIGWPELVNAVEGSLEGLSADERSRAVVLTRNYGEAGALTLLGGPDMPPVHSGHNSFGDWGPPDDARDVVVIVGGWDSGRVSALFESCERTATVSNDAEIANEELGAGVWVCRDPRFRWSSIWDEIAFLG